MLAETTVPPHVDATCLGPSLLKDGEAHYRVLFSVSFLIRTFQPFSFSLSAQCVKNHGLYWLSIH